MFYLQRISNGKMTHIRTTDTIHTVRVICRRPKRIVVNVYYGGFLQPGHGCAVFTKQQRRKYRLEPIETSVFNRTFIRRSIRFIDVVDAYLRNNRVTAATVESAVIVTRWAWNGDVFGGRSIRFRSGRTGRKQPPIESRYGHGKNDSDKKSSDGNVLFCTKRWRCTVRCWVRCWGVVGVVGGRSKRFPGRKNGRKTSASPTRMVNVTDGKGEISTPYNESWQKMESSFMNIRALERSQIRLNYRRANPEFDWTS